MHLGVYHFTGDPAALTTGYDKLVARFADELLLNICVLREDGISIYDACPSRTDFVDFSTSPMFRAALRDAGLPDPVVEHVGDVHAVAPHPTAVG